MTLGWRSVWRIPLVMNLLISLHLYVLRESSGANFEARFTERDPTLHSGHNDERKSVDRIGYIENVGQRRGRNRMGGIKVGIYP